MCAKCNTGYSLQSESGACVPCGANCDICMSNNSCIKCSEGFYLAKSEFSISGTCKQC